MYITCTQIFSDILPARFGFANAAACTRSIHLWFMKTEHPAHYVRHYRFCNLIYMYVNVCIT